MWLEKDQQTKEIRRKSSKELDETRESSLPIVSKEADIGAPPFEPIKFSPVIGTDIFEGEFAVKNEDVIFHFWPHGYHAADAAGRTTPSFKKGFPETLKVVFEKEFGKGRIEIQDDRDMGALFVRATGWAANQFHREISVKALRELFVAMGGVES